MWGERVEGVLCYTARRNEPAMTPERWQKLKELCHLALEREPSQRAPFLAEACRDDEELRREAESLIARATVDPATLDDSPEQLAGTVIGHYHLLQKIGEGGMGEVWLAEQKEPVRRRVALKLVKAGMNTREVIGRFESERQALALMEHPAIARVFEAGSTADGAPYFAMEYVPGLPITEYCDSHRLSIQDRLDLFIQVCEGVRHAHQKAVIHRDLKPSNILVTEVDGRAAPKIIDFGVAKALSQKLTAHTMFTRVGSLIGTPEYMSPEQALSSGEDVDTRTDVYSLGIIFYELLAGAPPIELRKVAFDEFLRRLREEDPPKPSAKIRTGDAATTTELARRRQTEPVALVKQIGGDLDSIALKALEKDRARRYGSAADFAADIARYLRHEPVEAVPPSATYRARKFASRHRWGLAMASAFVVVLATAAVISIRQTIRANREAAIAEAVNEFLQNDVLAQASASAQSGPTTKPDPDLKVRTALDRAAAKIGNRFANQPQVEASIRETIGWTYLDLGLDGEGQRQLERAVVLLRQSSGEGNSDTLLATRALADSYLHQGKFSDAEKLLKTILPVRTRVSGEESPLTVEVMRDLAAAYSGEGNYPGAEPLYLSAVEITRRQLGEDNPNTFNAMSDLGILYRKEGKYQQAEEMYERVLDIKRRVLGEDHPDTLLTMNTLGLNYSYEGRFSEAEGMLKKSLDGRSRILGPDHPSTLLTMNNLGLVYDNEGKFAEAEALLRQTLAARQRISGPEHPDTLLAAINLGDVLQNEGKLAEAEALISHSLEVSRRVSGEEHPQTLYLMVNLARVRERSGNYGDAEALLAKALEARTRVLGKQHDVTLGTAMSLGNIRLERREYDSGEPLLRETLASYEKSYPNVWQRYGCESLLGATLAGERKYAEAETLLLEGYQGMQARESHMAFGSRRYLEMGRSSLEQMYTAWGKPEKAAEWRKK
jgi:serine/threonine protein kinase/tetratricopeptide (TPR) repeat protein